MEGIAGLGVALAASVVLGIAGLLIIYKMVDGEMPFLSGITALFVIVLMLSLAINSPSPIITGVIFVVALAGLGLFPYAAEQIERAELRALDTERLINVYNGYMDRPDNIGAVFEIARLIWAHGMKANAIGLAGAALNTLSLRVDPVSNKSFRDTFRNEEYMLKNWNREAAKNPSILRPVACPNCGKVNPVENLVCEKCSRPYLIDIAHNMHLRPKIYGRLVVAFAILAGVIVGSSLVGVVFSGILSVVMLVLLLSAAGGLIHWLFRTPKPA